MEQTSITPEKPRETTAPASTVLAAHSARRITDREQIRLYQLEMKGQKPLISDRAYR